MTLAPFHASPAAPDEDRLLADLAQGGRDLGAIGPVLRHLVARPDTSLFGEEIVARTRGMVESLALGLLRKAGDRAADTQLPVLVARLCDHERLLIHVHALALEAQTTQALATRGIDSTLPPLLQQRMAGTQPDGAALAMGVLAAQTRFMRSQQRMELDFAELPAELLHDVLQILADATGAEGAGAVRTVQAGYDERRSRLALLAQVGLGLGDDFLFGLDPARAGFALFATALSLVTGQERDRVVVATARGHEARLGLMLAMAGLAPAAREAAVLCLHPDAAPAGAWLDIDGHRAAELLHGGGRS